MFGLPIPLLLPFGATPNYGFGPQSFGPGSLAPKGLFGSALGSLLGSAVGGLFGGAGSNIGNAIGGVAGGLLPFSSGPGLAVAGAEPGETEAKAAQKPVLLPQSFLDPDGLARRDMLQAATTGLIDKLVKYLGDNQSQESRLTEVTPLVQRAIELYKANDFQRAAVQAYLAFHTLESARAKHPELQATFG